MRHLTHLVSVVVALTAMACSGRGTSTNNTGAQTGAGDTGPSTEAPASTGTASVAAAPSASASTQAAPPKKRASRRVPKNIAALRAELDKRCPIAKTDNTMDEKLAFSDAVDCARKKMHADLDAVLLPLKASDPAKFKALMKEQAEWNRAMDKACALEEERMWVDFDTGTRDDGSYRTLTMLGCDSQSVTERTLFARSLAAGKLGPLVKRIEEVQKSGAEVKDIVAGIQEKSMAFAVAPPADPGLAAADWKEIVDEAGYLIGATKSLAKSTCETWPDLAKALGGKEKCLAKAELYYYVQGNNPSVGDSI